DGTMGYPETVLLRLIDSKGAPNVKVAATEDGSALSFGGESNPTHVQILARGATTSLKLVNHDGRDQLITPESSVQARAGTDAHRLGGLAVSFLRVLAVARFGVVGRHRSAQRLSSMRWSIRRMVCRFI